MKVDLCKAYDSVLEDFLFGVLLVIRDLYVVCELDLGVRYVCHVLDNSD